MLLGSVHVKALDQLFKDAVNRKPKRLSFVTTYSHTNIYDWLQTILTDWTISNHHTSDHQTGTTDRGHDQ